MPNETTIKCPKCHTEINVNEILYHQLEEELKQKNIAEQKKLQDEVKKKEKELQEQLQALLAKEDAIKEQKEKFDEELKKAIHVQLKALKQDKTRLEFRV